ncbi:Ti-type conjugative transfer relaxase TraA [Acidisoma silvae]|uniref:Ti-type conjugative transfer relaxase TraA n=1 Tax=Acidisoma silvae TaxID=2802396 RepID=A0A964E1Q2_9PROT|nr:Ti-type conjugative transfer relaxase TraA [Acidisoma silvae]MCB8878474.1 Ti-type conjugative transfer relaxase TraA [Acidisoma silvae]
MAIYHLSMKPICRSQGRSAVAAAAYRAGTVLTNARDGVTHDYTGRGGVVCSEIVLPAGVDAAWARDRSTLWNAAEAAEKRKDSRTAREFVLALPHELEEGAQRDLARGFAAYLADRYGAAVDMAIHRPDERKDQRNAHAHLLMTTRQVTPDGLGDKTQIEKNNARLQAEGLPLSHDQLRDIRQVWEEQANVALARAGHDVRIDHRSHAERGLEIEPTQYVGVHATATASRGKEVERRRIDPAAAARNAERIATRPEEALRIVTDEKSVFDQRDIARLLHRTIDQPQAFQAAMAKVMASPDLMELQPEQRNAQGRVVQPARYTTRDQFELEHDMARRADRMADGEIGSFDRAVEAAMTDNRLRRHSKLSDEQRNAVRHVCGAERIAAVVGLAGAGKSTMLAAALDVWKSDSLVGGVYGAALAGKAAEGLEQASGIPSRTLASWELSWAHGRNQLKRGDVFVIDEAGMVSSAQLARFVKAVDEAGAKLVLVGDPEQLQPINAGAAFRAIAERTGFVELEGIRRQTEAWQRKASVDFGRSRVADGLKAYDNHGADRDRARAAIVRDVMTDMASNPESSRIVLAHRRADVRSLNDEIRAARKEQGALADEARFETETGERQFAAGDRLVFLKNDSTLKVKNGMLGTVEIAKDGVLLVRLDGEGQAPGRKVAVEAWSYQAVDHGYATTIHKSQGATVDRAFVLASESMDKHLAYVGMTRHRTEARLYAGRDEFRDLTALSSRLSRSNAKETTLDYARAGYAERRGMVPRSEIVIPERTPPATRGAERVGQDSLRAKTVAVRERPAEVRDAVVKPETRRDAVRRELQGYDDRSLDRVRDADKVRDRDAWRDRPMTVEDSARDISPAYAAAADRAGKLAEEAARNAKSIEHYTGVLNYHARVREELWQAMGAVARLAQRAGIIRPDQDYELQDSMVAFAERELKPAVAEREVLAKDLSAAKATAAVALQKVQPAAEAKLEEIQERAALARELWPERAEQQRQRQRLQQERSREQDRGRDQGMER